MYRLLIKIKETFEEVELDNKFTVAFNKQFTDFKYPSAVKTGFSKTITILGTPHNNKLFDFFFNNGAIYHNNGYFNPNKKIEYSLLLNGIELSNGYMVVSNISKKKGEYVYSATLYDTATLKLYNMKYDEKGQERTLDGLIFGFDDENESYDYDMNYTLDSWALKGTVRGTNNEVWNYTGSNNSIKSYITPIYCNTGLYENFASNKFLVGYQDQNGNPLTAHTAPLIYDKNSKGYTNLRSPLLNEEYQRTEDDKTFSTYNGWTVFETERDLHPSEAGTFMASRLPLGINLQKTWDAIVDNFNIKTSMPYDYQRISDIFKDKYLLLDEIQEIKNINTNIKTSGSNTNTITSYKDNISTDEFYTQFNRVKFSQSVLFSLDEGCNGHITLKPSVSKNNKVGDNYFMGKMTIDQCPIYARFTSEITATNSGYSNLKYQRQERWCDNMLTYTVLVYAFATVDAEDTQKIQSYMTAPEWRTYDKVYVVSSKNFSDDSKLTNDEVSKIKLYIGDVLKQKFHYNITDNTEINTTYLYSEWDENNASSVRELICKNNIDVYFNKTNKNTKVIMAQCPMTVVLPWVNKRDLATEPSLYTDATKYTKGVAKFPQYDGSQYQIPIKPISGNGAYLYDYRYIRFRTDGELVKPTLSIADIKGASTQVFKYDVSLPQLNNSKNGNYSYRIFDTPICLNGCYLLRQSVTESPITFAFENFNTYTKVDFASYQGSEDVTLPKVSKQLLKSVKLFDLFLWMIKSTNTSIMTMCNDKLGYIYYPHYHSLFASEFTDLTDLIDNTEIKMTPSVIQSQVYNYGFDTVESYKDKLTKTFDPNYNIHSDTYDYNINEEPIKGIDNVGFKTLLPYQMESVFFNPNTLVNNDGQLYTTNQYIAPNKGVSFKQALYHFTDANKVDKKEFEKVGLLYNLPSDIPISQYVKDEETKLCLFDKDIKTVDFGNAVVCFNGFNERESPITITQDIPATQQILDTFCYVLYPRRSSIYRGDVMWDVKSEEKKAANDVYFDLLTTPKFDNYSIDNGEKFTFAFTNLDNEDGKYNLYDKCFSENEMIYNTNHKVMTAKVRLNRITYTIDDLLGNLFYYDNCYWLLNKINNCDFTKDFNECEFIQIDYDWLLDYNEQAE